MKFKIVAMLLTGIFLCVGAPAFSQDDAGENAEEEAAVAAAEEEEGARELSFAGAPYVYTGPDTGAGAGFSIMFRDLFEQEGRDVTFSMSYTENQYENYSVDWQEPYFLSPNGRLKIYLRYESKPAIRFYGFGNDSEVNDDCNWSWVTYNFEPTYIYRFPKTDFGVIGVRGKVLYMFADPDNGKLDEDDPEDFSFNRPIKRVYPDLYRSDDFRPTTLVIPGFSIYLDRRVDRFPLGGGREEVVWPMKGGYYEVSYERSEEGLGADFTYNKFMIDVRQFFPLFNPDTIVAARVKTIITQGNTPFYQMPNFGGGNDLRGYYAYRFLDENSMQLQVELRQGFLPDWELPLLGGIVVLKYPSVFLFWDEGRVFDDYTKIGDEMWEDYHYAWGGGFRFVITPSVVIRVELGNSDEQSTFYLSAGLPF